MYACCASVTVVTQSIAGTSARVRVSSVCTPGPTTWHPARARLAAISWPAQEQERVVIDGCCTASKLTVHNVRTSAPKLIYPFVGVPRTCTPLARDCVFYPYVSDRDNSPPPSFDTLFFLWVDRSFLVRNPVFRPVSRPPAQLDSPQDVVTPHESLALSLFLALCLYFQVDHARVLPSLPCGPGPGVSPRQPPPPPPA
ncbi:uncharacterized protein LY79DRAFT_238604 [Colletotrichum navitas]|uniref:Uncharacterized protein n=1 Tax=Colletotrichum navitas TaxID=681940 RepID=A0AAD8V2C3_9PEZI|nr:uncharacterized protein LY79DRAFT_238604 [Colletotrichum navitas]KAK1589695.1 hypothetical protein LY79DRAFT_238604 [Colletotrichum navitas]